MVMTLKGTFRREVDIENIGRVIVCLTPEGISMRVKGARSGVSAVWPQLIAASKPPSGSPGPTDPFKYLQQKARSVVKRKIIKELRISHSAL